MLSARIVIPVLLTLATVGLAFGVDESPPIPPADPAVYGIELDDSAMNHWAFQPIASPAVPLESTASNSPIDAFIRQKLGEVGLRPSPPVDRRTWLRRVTFDLIGLPPTPEELAAFVKDDSPQARERVIDRLLADPGYGVRWGRRWLDVVRYADTNGYERDGNKPHAWRYRDYVIDSLNRDKPFDQFLTEQLAGDEVDEVSAETLIATTCLRLGTWDDEPADPVVDRCEQLDDIVGAVSATFLGLTLRCARCHNHKFEPLSQLDYAGMLAVFDPLKRPQNDRADLDVPVGTRAELVGFAATEATMTAAIQAVKEQLAALEERVRERLFASGKSSLTAAAIEAHRIPMDQRTDAARALVKLSREILDAEILKTRTADETKQRTSLMATLKAQEQSLMAKLPRAYIWQEPPNPPVTQVLKRGNPQTPAGRVEPGFPAVLSRSHMPLLSPGQTTRRRLSLARWLTDEKNPLTARVIVNRIWQGHFGNGLVGSENDFGVMGDQPTHPELLDWLATQLRQNGWRLKPLHRMICLSETYGQSSTAREAGLKSDVDNKYLWRFPYRRLEAEAVRDAVLAVSGQLNPKMGGPGVYPPIAREILEGQSRPGEGWVRSDEREASRRSAYVFVKRSLLLPEMELLDLADTTTSCEQRSVSTIPTQALTFLNGQFLNAQAKFLAERLRKDAGYDVSRQVARGYQLALGRLPAADELSAATQFLSRQASVIQNEDQSLTTGQRDPAATALAAWCVVLLNLNEFVYID